MRVVLTVLALSLCLPGCAQIRSTTQAVASGARNAYYRVGSATRQAPECGPCRVSDPVYDAGWCGAESAQPIATGAFARSGT